jgi:hypothetical protein
MPATTGLDIVTKALVTIGVSRPGATIEAGMADDAFWRLNAFVGGLALQPLTIPAVSREVFPLTANVGTYTIGPGGNFDTTQPVSIDGAAVLLNNNLTPVAVTSITRSGSVATVTTTAPHGAATGQNATIQGATPESYNGTWPITVTGASTFTYVFAGAAASASGTITAFLESNLVTVVEWPIPVVTNDARQMNPLKSLTSPLITSLFYNPTNYGGLGLIQLWPIPTVTTNALVIYSRQALSRFVSLSAEYILPEGTEEVFVYGLARRLLTPFAVTDPGTVSDVMDLARTSMASFKRSNNRLTDLPNDYPGVRGMWNIVTDTIY